jgi:SAM-dependent methyltransferase
MSHRYTDSQIKTFWTDQAVRHGQSPAASWSDHPVMELEIAELVKHLADGDRVLDIGCANGFTTCRLAIERRIEAVGVDYIPEMIDQANARLAGDPAELRDRVRFGVGDILALDQPEAAFDKVVVIRVLINLGERERQRRGLLAALARVRPGGLLLLSEATVQGWERLNAFRREWRLPDIPMPAFNNYLDEADVIGTAAPYADLVQIAHFASTYYVFSRVLKPLLSEALGHRVDVADASAEWNRFASQLPACGDYGVQRLFIFRKR